MNFLAVCHDCRRQHFYSNRDYHDMFRSLGEWREKHPQGRCNTDILTDLPGEGHRLAGRVQGYGHNADTKIAYASSAAMTITLASLAESATHVVGRESTAVSNTSNLYLDYLLGGKITTGTSPTANEAILVYVYGAINDTPDYPDTLTGTDSGVTFASANLRDLAAQFFQSITIDSTSNETYWLKPRAISGAFGGAIPKNWGVWITHDTDVNLNSTAGNHAMYYTGVYSTVA